MRNVALYLVSALIILCAGCEPQRDNDLDANKKLVQRFVEISNAAAWGRPAETVAVDFKRHSTATAGPPGPVALLSVGRTEEEQTDMKALTEFAARYAAAWSGQDAVVFASFYAENGSLRINDGEPSVGRDAIAETARSFMAAFPDMVVRLAELREVNDHVEFHWHWTGTNSGPGGTGNAVDLRGYERWTLDKDGLILESHGNMDDAEYQRQLNADSADVRAEQ